MEVVRKSSCGSAPQFCGKAFSHLDAQVLFVCSPVIGASGWKSFLVSGGLNRDVFFSCP